MEYSETAVREHRDQFYRPSRKKSVYFQIKIILVLTLNPPITLTKIQPYLHHTDPKPIPSKDPNPKPNQTLKILLCDG